MSDITANPPATPAEKSPTGSTGSAEKPAEFKLEHGTREEHIATLKRSKAAELESIWSGDMRNPYLRENLQFAEHEKIVKLTPYDSREAQESGWTIEWLDHPEV